MFNKAHESLYQWYEKNGRHDLPWRLTDDPYKIYLSEIMLQQTQVKTVLERFYFPFLEAFPTLQDVADSDLDDVLKKWEGLGYYTRAKNLHNAARQCKGVLPQNAEGLMELSGVGRSTAHAVAAFAYREALPILDANVKRILYRFFALQERNEKRLWEYAYLLFDPAHPFEYNQAMMDLGSMVCINKKPLCASCPFGTACAGKTAPSSYPEEKTRSVKPIRPRSIVIYRRNGRYALMQRKSRFLHGLWGFFETEQRVEGTGKLLGHLTQHYSHFTLEAAVYLSQEPFEDEGYEWFELHEFSSLSMSRADHKAAALLRYNVEKKESVCGLC